MPPRVNPQAITSWQNWLNTNFGAGWFPLDNFHSLTLNGEPSRGIPVKAFWNTNTGEIKIFDARKFTL